MATDRVASYGRGGAGNILKDDPTNYPQADELVTPTLKSDTYTTGRGGTGNMAHNYPERPEVARAAQDVETPPSSESAGPKHIGRGGAANIIGSNGQPAQRNNVEAKHDENSAGKGLLAKGKEFLNNLGKR